MEKIVNFVDVFNAINLLLDENVSIGSSPKDGRYALVSNKFFEDSFSELAWEVVTEFNEPLQTELTFAYVTFAGVKFGTFVGNSFRERHKDRTELKEAMA